MDINFELHRWPPAPSRLAVHCWGLGSCFGLWLVLCFKPESSSRGRPIVPAADTRVALLHGPRTRDATSVRAEARRWSKAQGLVHNVSHSLIHSSLAIVQTSKVEIAYIVATAIVGASVLLLFTLPTVLPGRRFCCCGFCFFFFEGKKRGKRPQ